MSVENVITPRFRASYPKVFKAELNTLSNELEYSLVALFELGADLSALKTQAEAACADKWGPDRSLWPKATLPDGTQISAIRSPFRDQADRPAKDKSTGRVLTDAKGAPVLQPGHVKGAIYLTLKARQRPGLVDQNVQPILDESVFYAGCYARAEVRAYAYDQKGNRGVSFGLQNLQKLDDGDPLSGRNKAEAVFAPVAAAAAGQGATSGSIF